MLLSMYVPPSRASIPVFGFAAGSFAAGAAFAAGVAFAAGGGDGGFAAFAGVFAATFAVALCNGGYAGAAAAAFAGGGDGGFDCFGAGDFAGDFACGGSGGGLLFADNRRFFASSSSGWGGGFFSLGGGAGLVAALLFPVLLDLAFGSRTGSDDALSIPHGFLCGFAGIRCCSGSINSGVCDNDLAILPKNAPNCLVSWWATAPCCDSLGAFVAPSSRITP